MKRDVIRVVEAAYDLEASESRWLQGVCDAIQRVAQVDLGMVGYHIDQTPRGLRIGEVVQSPDVALDLVAQLRPMRKVLDAKRRGKASVAERARAALFEKILRIGIEEPATQLTMAERRSIGPRWMHHLGSPANDQLVFVNTHIDGQGATAFVGASRRRVRLQPATRSMYGMLGAHVQAGLRLRRRLPAGPLPVDAPEGGAVLDRRGAVVHAEGDARGAAQQEALQRAAGQLGKARSRALGRGLEALEVWEGLIAGTWSLVERFDTDGQRFVLAHRNPHQVRDPRGLTPMEARIVGLVLRGYADKMVAYHLGVAPGTVSSHLVSAMRKLGVERRTELIRLLGPLYPGGAPGEREGR